MREGWVGMLGRRTPASNVNIHFSVYSQQYPPISIIPEKRAHPSYLLIQKNIQMKAELQLKRDIFRQSIRREHINKALKSRREQLMATTPTPTTSLLPRILSTYKSPFSISQHLQLLNELALLPASSLAHPDLLKYLQKLTSKRFDREIVSEEWEEVFELVKSVLGRFLQGEPPKAVQQQHLLWQTLQNVESCWLWGVLSEYTDEPVKKVAFQLFHKYVEGLDTERIVHEELGWIYSNFVTKVPKASFTQASQVAETFVKVCGSLSDDDYYDYLASLLEISREQHQIQYLNQMQVLPLVRTRLACTKDTALTCLCLKFTSMMFRGSDALSLRVFLDNPAVTRELDRSLDLPCEEVNSWGVFALGNFCANGPEFVKTVLQADTVAKAVGIYGRASNKVREEIVFLFYVMCQKGGDKLRMRLYEENVLGVVVREMGGEGASLEICLKIVYSLLLSAVKMDSLEMTYTQTITRELITKHNFKRRLEELIAHPKEAVGNLALLLLNTYMQRPLLF